MNTFQITQEKIELCEKGTIDINYTDEMKEELKMMKDDFFIHRYQLQTINAMIELENSKKEI